MNYPAVRQCPVCGKYRFEVEFEECPICSWMNDVTQEENPDAKGLANIMSLNECRKAYAEGKEFYQGRNLIIKSKESLTAIDNVQ